MIERTVQSPNWSPRPNGINDVWGLLLHHTASPETSALATAQFLARPSTQASAHEVFGMHRGEVMVVHCIPWHRAAWHAGTCRAYDLDRDGRPETWESRMNTHTIGFEICNLGDGRDSFPDPLVRAVAAYVRKADRICPNLKLRNVTDHEAVNLRGKIDLQPNFPAAKLFWYVLHPRTPAPRDVYASLPRWARRQVDEIKR